MDPQKIHVSISGPLLSQIFHESQKRQRHCEGILFGEGNILTHNEVTDSQTVTKTMGCISVLDHCPMSMTEMLTQKRNTGSWMSALTNSPMSNCIGIFRVRKLTMELTMLEKSMHRKISREITKENQQTPNFVISFILSLQTESSKTCLSWNNAAFVFHKGSFVPIKIKISNLQGSVSGSYLTNMSPLRSTNSQGVDQTLQTFTSYLFDKNRKIEIVEKTRQSTEALIRELSDQFAKLHENEIVLELSLTENTALLKQWNSLLDKKEYLSSLRTYKNKDTNKQEKGDLKQQNEPSENPTSSHNESGIDHERSTNQNNDANKVKPAWIRPKKIPVENLIENSDNELEPGTYEEFCDSSILHSDDPFANLVNSAKQELNEDTERSSNAFVRSGQHRSHVKSTTSRPHP